MNAEGSRASSGSLDTTPLRQQSPPTTASDHLSFPSASTSVTLPPPPTITQPKKLRKDRLYVGNLHPTVDEYTLLQIFQKYGKINKLDFLFHKTGPLQGKPRGYAFVEYAEPNEADHALTSANDKLLRGRKLVVTYAHQAPTDDSYGGGRSRKAFSDPSKPTTLSLLKSSASGRHNATKDKIAKMEAKLRQMEQSEGSSSRPLSLPPKPLVMDPQLGGTLPPNLASLKGKGRAGPPLPSLPLQPSAPVVRDGMSTLMSSASASSGKRVATTARRVTGLQGVKIVKHRDK